METGGYNKDRLAVEYADTFYESQYIFDQLKRYGLTGAEIVRFPGGNVWDAIKGELWEKTIRQKGHAEGVNTLKACGLFSRQPISVRNMEVVPREVLEMLLESRLKLGKERDATLLRIVVSGKKSGKPETHVFEMIDHYDDEKAYTSMAKTTCFPASIAAQMIVSGMVPQKGSLFPEDIFFAELYWPFMDALKSRGVVVSHRAI